MIRSSRWVVRRSSVGPSVDGGVSPEAYGAAYALQELR